MNVRWNLSVSAELDRRVRQHLAAQGANGQKSLSRFVEKAARDYLRQQLLAGITDDNRHAVVDFGPEQGNEAF